MNSNYEILIAIILPINLSIYQVVNTTQHISISIVISIIGCIVSLYFGQEL